MDQVSSWLNGGGFQANDLNPNSPLLQYAPEQRRKRPEYKAFAAIRPETRAFQPRKWRVWTAAFGGTQSLRGDAAIGGVDSSSRAFGLAGGVDYQVGPDLLVGVAAAGTSSEFSVPGRATNGTLGGAHLGLYGVYRWGAAYLSGTLSYGHFRNDTTRTIVGVGATEIARGEFASDQFGGRLQAGRQFAFDQFRVTPFAAVQYMRLWQSGYGEASVTAAGAPGIFGLNVQPRTATSLPTFLGAEIDTRIDFAHGATLVPFARASWVHEFMPDRSIAAAMGILPTGTFIVDGPRAASDAARIEAGSNLYLRRNIAFFANFTGEYSSQGISNAGSGGLRVSW
jgi:outer membrane autotransporter protein